MNRILTDTPSGTPAKIAETIVPPKIAQVALTEVDRINPIRFTTVRCSCMAIPKTSPQTRTETVRLTLFFISWNTPSGIILRPVRPILSHTITTDIPYIMLIKACTGKLSICFTVWNHDPQRKVTKMIPAIAICVLIFISPFFFAGSRRIVSQSSRFLFHIKYVTIEERSSSGCFAVFSTAIFSSS